MSLEQELAPFDYDLPDECMQFIHLRTSDSKLLVLGRILMNHETLWCKNYGLLPPGDVLVLNDTRVCMLSQSTTITGGKVSVLPSE